MNDIIKLVKHKLSRVRHVPFILTRNKVKFQTEISALPGYAYNHFFLNKKFVLCVLFL